jgi:outer membrane protein assembly factor BamB
MWRKSKKLGGFLFINILVILLCYPQQKQEERKDRLLWQWEGKSISNLVANTKGVYITDKDELYRFNPADGKKIWKIKIKEIKEEKIWISGVERTLIYAYLTLHEDRLFIGTTNGLYCHDAETGKRTWGIKTNGSVGEVTVAKDRVYFWSSTQRPFSKSEIYCLKKDSGEVIWKTSKYGGAHTPARVIVVKKRLYGLNNQGVAFCLDADSGKKIWRNRAVTITFGSPAVDEKGERMFVRFSMNVTVYCLDARNGKRIWRWKSGTPSLGEGSSLVYHDGRVYCTG